MQLREWQQWSYYSQWIIAAGAAFQCFETAARFSLLHIDPWFYVLVFCVTLCQYMLHFRFYQKDKPLNRRQHFFAAHRTFLLIQFILAAGFALAGFILAGGQILLAFCILGIFTFCYSFFLRTSPRTGIFRYNGLFKILTITVTWSAVTGLLPVLAAGEPPLAPRYLFFYLTRLLMMLAICLPFDVRDVQGDKRYGTMTLPALIGNRSTFIVCYLCLATNVVLVFLSVIPGWNSLAVAFLNALANLVLLLSINYSSRNLANPFSWFLLDSNLLLHSGTIALALLF